MSNAAPSPFLLRATILPLWLFTIFLHIAGIMPLRALSFHNSTNITEKKEDTEKLVADNTKAVWEQFITE